MKFKKGEIWQVKTEMFDLKSWLEVKTKNKDLYCPECKRSFKEIGEKVALMTLHGKGNTPICNECGRKYIKLGAIDINSDAKLREDLRDKIIQIDATADYKGKSIEELQEILSNVTKVKGEYDKLHLEILSYMPSEEDWEIEDYLISQYGVYQDEKYLTHESQIEETFRDIGCEYLECGQGFYQDSAEVIAKIGKKFYKVTIYAEICSAKQDVGDRLYWVERIKSVEYEEIEKPKFKDKVYYSYEIKLSREDKILLEKYLKRKGFEWK